MKKLSSTEAELKRSVGYKNTSNAIQGIIKFLFSKVKDWFAGLYTEAVARRCSVKKVFLNISQNS